MSKHRFFQSLLFIVITSCLLPGISWGLLIIVPDSADFKDTGTDPCPRSSYPSWGDCCVESVLNRKAVDETHEVFQKGWAAWNDTFPEEERWTLTNGKPLLGTLDFNMFDTFNECPGTGGVELDVSYYPFEDNGKKELESWYWCQAIYVNFEAGEWYAHDSDHSASWYGMDVSYEPGFEYPPLYPVQEPDGSFYDMPRGLCVEDSTIFFHGVALICQIDWLGRNLTVYDGFSYSWEFKCSSPEPASVVILLIFGLSLALVRRKIE